MTCLGFWNRAPSILTDFHIEVFYRHESIEISLPTDPSVRSPTLEVVNQLENIQGTAQGNKVAMIGRHLALNDMLFTDLLAEKYKEGHLLVTLDFAGLSTDYEDLYAFVR